MSAFIFGHIVKQMVPSIMKNLMDHTIPPSTIKSLMDHTIPEV